MRRVGGIAGVLLLLLATLQVANGAETTKSKKSSSKKTSASQRTDPAAAKTAVRAILDEQVAAWNRGDLKGYMQGYWQSQDLTFFGGRDKTMGWDAAYQRYTTAFLGKDKQMGELTFNDLKVELLDAQAAYVRGEWQLTQKDGTKSKGLFTVVLKKFHEGWRIVHDHSS